MCSFTLLATLLLAKSERRKCSATNFRLLLPSQRHKRITAACLVGCATGWLLEAMAVSSRTPAASRHACGSRRRRQRCAASAADDLCKDKVNDVQDLKGESSTMCTVHFKGADGRTLPVEMPVVRAWRVVGSCAAAPRPRAAREAAAAIRSTCAHAPPLLGARRARTCTF